MNDDLRNALKQLKRRADGQRQAMPPTPKEAQALLDERDALRQACEAVMRPDGHYRQCPCNASVKWEGVPRATSGHIFMPNNPTVAICKQLRAALAKGEAQ